MAALEISDAARRAPVLVTRPGRPAVTARARTVQRELDRAMRDVDKGIPPAIPSDSFVQVERKAVEIRLLRDHLAVLEGLRDRG